MKRYVAFALVAMLAGLWLVSCSATSAKEGKSVKDAAIEKCIQLCKDAKEKGKDLSNGPCLSDDNPDWNIADWVCDVAHSPRQPVDNKPENQCREYREGKAHHFVEVNPNCEFIKAY